MNAQELFWEKRKQIFAELGDHAVGALATSDHNVPYVRSVSCIMMDGQFFFQSDRTMNKCVQIRENPKVSLCFQHINLQGTCIEMGNPMAPGNERFYLLFSRHFPGAARRYSGMTEERVYVVKPVVINTWRYIDGKPYQEKLDMDLETYQIWQYKSEDTP